MSNGYKRYLQICSMIADDEKGTELLADFMGKACEYIFSKSMSSRDVFLKALSQFNDYCYARFGNCPEYGIVPFLWQIDADSDKIDKWIGELIYTIYQGRQR